MGETFASKKEAERYKQLLLLQRAGKISDLRRQVSFELIPTLYENGKFLMQGVRYVADFTYTRDGKMVVEDAKGYRTPVYKIKKKMMYHYRKIKIEEV